MCWRRYPIRCKVRPRWGRRKSGWRKPKSRPIKPSIRFCVTLKPSIPRRWPCWKRTANHSWPFTTFRPNTGYSSVRRSTFATIRHRTTRTKNCVSRNALLGLVFQLTPTAEKGWRKIRGFKHLPDVIDGVRFQDGIAVVMEPGKTEESQQMAA